MRKAASWLSTLVVIGIPVLASAEAPRGIEAQPQVSVSGGSYKCGNPSSSSALATLKNTSTTADNTYSLTWQTIAQGACTKMDSTKNANGTPCAKGALLCTGYCEAYGPDVTKSFPGATVSIPKGGTKQVTDSIPNAIYKKIDVVVAETGVSSKATFSVATNTTVCTF